MDPNDFERVEIRAVEELWTWLETHHARPDGVLLVTFKRSAGDRYVAREDILDALVAFGWTDGRRFTLDDDRTMQLVSPRRQATWARSYRERAERLIVEGRMQPSGGASILAAKSEGRWDAADHVDALTVPPDLLESLQAADAHAWWEASAPSYRRNVLRWIDGAKRPDTRHGRIATVTDHSAAGMKVPNY